MHCIYIVVVRIFNATRQPRHIEGAAIVMLLSVTKRRPVHFILNPGHVEYELGVQIVWKFSRTHDTPLKSQVR